MSTREKFNENNYIGKQFGFLTISKFTNKKKCGKTQFQRYCLCACLCGSIKEYSFSNIKSGRTKSCGCKPYKHFKDFSTRVSKSPLYNTWSHIMIRCYNPGYKSYKDYGGRGITVCKRWHNIENFIKDIPNLLGEKPTPKHSLDRKNNNKGYSPNNVRWATSEQQNNNKRYSNELTRPKLAKLTGYSEERIRQMTYKTSSAPKTSLILEKSVHKKINNNKNTLHIYKQSAINILLKNRS